MTEDEEIGLGKDTALLRAEVAMFFSDFFGNGRTASLAEKWNRIHSIIWILSSMMKVEGADPSPIRKIPELKIDNVLEAEYAKMFYGLSETVVPLLESSWWNREQMVCQDANRRAAKFYADHGFGMKEGDEWQADHLSVELAFLAKLLAELPDSKDEVRRFFDTHVRNFGLLFAQEATKHPNADLTKPVLEALTLYLRTEEALQKLVADSNSTSNSNS